MRTFVCWVALACTVLISTGCASWIYAGQDDPPAYPTDISQSDTLDIQVFRRGTRLIATNTSARAFGPSRIWINQEFSLPIDEFGVGKTLELELTRFENDLGKRFRAGGFFATLSPKRVVLVQLQEPDADDLFGFIMVQDQPQ